MENKILLIDFLRLMDEGERLRIRIRNVYEEGKRTELEFEEENSEGLWERLSDSKVYVEDFFYSSFYVAYVINCISEE